jgi:hypothetical protein
MQVISTTTNRTPWIVIPLLSLVMVGKGFDRNEVLIERGSMIAVVMMKPKDVQSHHRRCGRFDRQVRSKTMSCQTLSIVRVEEICKWQAGCERASNRCTADDGVKINRSQRERDKKKHKTCLFGYQRLLSAPFPGHDMEAETGGARYTSKPSSKMQKSNCPFDSMVDKSILADGGKADRRWCCSM